MKKIKCTPEKETLVTNIIERTIGRVVKVEPHTKPFGPASEDLIGDIFHALYNAEMEPVEDKHAPYDRAINHALMKWMRADGEFMQAREKTTGKLAHSLASTKFMYEYLIQDDVIREALMAQEKTPPPPPMGGGGGGEGDGDDDRGLSDALAKLKRLSKNVIGSQVMSVGAKQAEQKADEVDGVLRAWGVGPGEITTNNIEDIMQLVDGNDSKMQKISELAGRLESIVASSLEKVRENYIGQVADTKRTREFEVMYGTELAYLLSPDMPPLIHAKYVADYIEVGLLGVETRSEGKDFGSIYIMVDGSGSMEGALEIHAKAIALGLAKALNRDSLNKRVYRLNTFGGGEHDGFISVSSDEEWKEHFKWATLMQNGGTDFDYAFKKAMEDIKENMPEGTDFVFITDGSCMMKDSTINAWNKFRSETGTRLLYVDVSGANNPQVRKLCDMYLKVSFQGGNMEFIASDIASKLAENMETSRLDKRGSESED